MPCFLGLCPRKLDLSNTPDTAGSLSFPKPPHRRSSFAAFLTLLDGIEAPGKGNRGTLQGSVPQCSSLFRQRTEPDPTTWSGSYPTPRVYRPDSGRYYIIILLFPDGTRLLEPVKSRFPQQTAETGSFPVTGRIRLLSYSLGATGLERPPLAGLLGPKRLTGRKRWVL